MADLAKYVVSLEAETAKYRAELEKANRQLSRFTADQKKSLDAVKDAFKILAAAVATSAITGYIRQSIDAADAAAKLAQKIGVSTETITGLNLGLELAGVSTDDFAKAMLRLSRVANDANKGLATAEDTFATLGISVADSSGRLKSTDTLLRQVADKFAGLADGTQKAALAQELFGRSGATLIPFLNQGSRAIEDAIRQSRELGLVWSTESAKAAEQFNDSLTVLAAVSRGWANQTAQQLLPQLNALTSYLIDIAPKADQARGGLTSMQVVVGSLASAVLILSDGFGTLGRRLGALAAAGSFIAKGDFSGAAEVWRSFQADVEQRSARIEQAFEELWSGAGEAAQTAAAETTTAVAQMLQAVEPVEQRVKSILAAVRKPNSFVRDQAMTSADEFLDADKARREAFADVVEGLRTEEEAIRDSYDRRLQIILQSTEAGSEAQRQLIERLKAQTDEQLEAIGEKTGTLSEFGLEAARNIQTAFADFLFDPFEDGLDGMLSSFLETIKRMVAEVASQQILGALFGGFAGSTNPILAGLGAFGGARANGGPVSGGRAYLVGERGPELFVPGGSGRIVPGGGGVSVQVVDQRGAAAPPVDIQRQMVGGMEQIRVMIRSEVGGMFADGTIDRQFRAASMPVRRVGSR